MLQHITISQSRYINPSTSERYFKHCRENHIEPRTLQAKTATSTVSAHWLGHETADTVILYLHGGGYTQSANLGNFKYLSRLVKDLNSQRTGRSVSVLFLAYTLVPEATYPTQLQEAAAMLAHLIHDLGFSPSNIILSGDSAGGNLALSLLSHILHAHPNVPAIKLDQGLCGVLLYSPWSGFSTAYSSYSNEKLDMLSPVALRKWSAMLLNKANPTDPETDPGSVSGDAWTEACLNPASWWEGLHKVAHSIFVSFGSDEVLADPIKDLGRELKTGWVDGHGDARRVVFLEAHKEAHIGPIVDIMVPGTQGKKSRTQVAIEEWYKERLQK